MAAGIPPGRVRVGTSGWSYPHWKGPFYPPELASGEELAFIARHFASVEINATFYRLPTAAAVTRWRAAVPEDFIFAVKASRYITHVKKLKEPERTLPPFLEVVSGLGEKLGPFLFQLPPRWRFDSGRLAAFLAALPKGQRAAFEFRDESWFGAGCLSLLAASGAALCFSEIAGQRAPEEPTADFAYYRLHGPGEAYEGSYDEAALQTLAGKCLGFAARGLDVYCYFDNDQAGFAAKNAARLRELTPGGAQ